MQTNNSSPQYNQLKSLISQLGGLSIIITILSYFFYALYLKMKNNFWGHPEEYITLLYYDVISENAFIVLYLLPTIIILAAILDFILEKRGSTTSSTLIKEQNKSFFIICTIILVLFSLITIIMYITEIDKFLVPLIISTVIFLLFFAERFFSRNNLSTEDVSKRNFIFRSYTIITLLTICLPIMIYYSSINPIIESLNKVESLQIIKDNATIKGTNIENSYYYVSEKNGFQIWRRINNIKGKNEFALSNEYKLFTKKDIQKKTIYVERFKFLTSPETDVLKTIVKYKKIN